MRARLSQRTASCRDRSRSSNPRDTVELSAQASLSATPLPKCAGRRRSATAAPAEARPPKRAVDSAWRIQVDPVPHNSGQLSTHCSRPLLVRSSTACRTRPKSTEATRPHTGVFASQTGWCISPNLHHHSVFALRTAGVDVKHPLRIAALDASTGRIARLKRSPREGPESTP